MITTFHQLSLIVCGIFVIILTVYNIYEFGVTKESFVRRSLSATVDLNTGENVKTVNGTIPEVSCPLGTYRPSGSTVLRRVSGQRQDGCQRCPKGRYGDKMGLTHPSCSGVCPVGTYGDEDGLKSKKECKLCPPGTYGTRSGLTTATCSGLCPKGTYSDSYGSRKCKKCPPNYNMWQCGESSNV
eukprot:gene10769-11738_t